MASNGSKQKNKNIDGKSFEAKLKTWSDEFLHSPVGFDGRSPKEIIEADLAQSRQIFKRELPKRKAIESMKNFKSKDGLELRYWFAQKPGNAKVKILVHGSGSNFAKADRAVSLLDRGYNVAMISYRGHSGNHGIADQKTIISDIKSAIENVIQLGYKMEDVYLEGSSLGTACLAHAMNRIYQASGTEYLFAGLILKAAPLNLNERDKDTVESLNTHGIDYDKAQPFLKKLWNQEEAYASIRAKEITIVHGTDDDVVPVEHAHKIKALLERKNDNIVLKIIDGEGHMLNLNEYGIY
jgi:uncharacterized protein